MLRLVISLLAFLAVAKARDVGKVLRTMPVVTNSLVNLGKMDIAFYFNARSQDSAMRSEVQSHGLNSFFSPRSEPLITEPCPCSSLKYIRDSKLNHPSELLNKILSGNDLFSFKEPPSSTLCCDSHENVHEDILLEFGPKQSQIFANQQNSIPFLPYFLDSIQNKPNSFDLPAKAKALEIFIIPKKRGLSIDDKKKDAIKKDNIKIVGDREIRNDFKSPIFVPPLLSSVKKDLTLQEKNDEITKKGDGAKFTTDDNSNTV